MAIIITDVLYASMLSGIFFLFLFLFIKNLLKKHKKTSKNFLNIIHIELLSQAGVFKGKIYLPIVFIQCIYFIVSFLHLMDITPLQYAFLTNCSLTFVFSLIVFLENIYLNICKNGLNFYKTLFPNMTILSFNIYIKTLVSTLKLIFNIIKINVMAELSLSVIWLFFIWPNYYLFDAITMNIYIFCLIIKFIISAFEAFILSVIFCSYLDDIYFIHQ